MDLLLFHAVNGLAGNPILDWLVESAEKLFLFKGDITIAAFWWFWFAGNDQQRAKYRRIIIATLLASFAAVIIARGLTVFLPFRVRPLYDPTSGYHPLSIHFQFTAEDWSSFPSDHAAMWFALCYGLWRMSRILGVVAYVYSAIVVCAVRVYLGYHYPSDLVAGAMIGLVAGWVVLRLPLSVIITPMLALERTTPRLFYALAFMLSFEVATIFDNVRALMHGMHILHPSKVALVGIVIALALAAGGLLWRRRRHPIAEKL